MDFARISGTVTGYPQGASLCAILVIMILAIVVMTMVIEVILEARVWDDRGGEERGNEPGTTRPRPFSLPLFTQRWRTLKFCELRLLGILGR